jgi:siderophore synthetase component
MTDPSSAELDDHRRAVDVVGRRLWGAAYREGLAEAPPDAHQHAFNRVELGMPVTDPPGKIMDRLGVDAFELRTELDDAVENLTIAYSRRRDIDGAWRKVAADRGIEDAYGVVAGLDPDAQAVAFEQLATDGHNLHPCGRTRLGWGRDDVLAYDQESPGVAVAFVAIRSDLHVGDDIGALLRHTYPTVPASDDGYVVQPVHPWQLEHVLRQRYADFFDDGRLRDVGDTVLSAVPTTALRTLLVQPDVRGQRHYLKLSLDIQVTSTRRSISVASTRNGPAISDILRRLITDPRVLVLPEVAGAAMIGTRDVAAIVRDGLKRRLGPREVAIPGSSLPAISPVSGRTILAEVVNRSGMTAGDFLLAYARLLLPQALRLLDKGVGLEAHLQNSIPIFLDGKPHRIAFRDCAGLRINPQRLSARGVDLRLWPDSVIGTPDEDVVRAKLGYTAFQAHLGELVIRLGESHGFSEAAAWRSIRGLVDEVYADGDLDPGDRDFLLAETMPHKALVRMRIAADGDIYVPVANPLHRDD